MNACASVTEQVNDIAWPDNNSAGNMLHRIRGQRFLNVGSVVLKCLGWNNYDGQNFADQDLLESNFTGANLSKCFMYRADLRRATFDKANLADADISTARIDGLSANGANLTKAD